MVSREAIDVYDKLLSAEEQEREILARDDAEIGALLLGEKPTSLPGSTA